MVLVRSLGTLIRACLIYVLASSDPLPCKSSTSPAGHGLRAQPSGGAVSLCSQTHQVPGNMEHEPYCETRTFFSFNIPGICEGVVWASYPRVD